MGVFMCGFVYVLGSHLTKDGKEDYRTYVGWTNDLDKRIKAHNSGAGAKSTKGRDWHLLYAERHETKQLAMSREWYLKRDTKFRKSLKYRMI